MNYNPVHIGNLIAARLKVLGMTPTELMRRMNLSTRNGHILLQKSDIELIRLRAISRVLEHDFFQYLLADESKLPSEPVVEPPSISSVPEFEQLQKENDFLKKEIEYLKEINQLLKGTR